MNDREAMRHDSPDDRRRSTPDSNPRAAGGRRLASRPGVEVLEVRALLSYGGGPDFSFGDHGSTGSGFSAPITVTSTASVLQPDGKLVVVGEQTTAESTGGSISVPVSVTSGFDARRYNPNGTLDPTFVNAGLSFIGGVTVADAFPSPPSYTGATGVALTPDHKILVVGDFDNTAVLLRLDSNGGLDPTFGKGGVVVLGSETSNGPIDYASTVASLPGGLIAVGGAGGPGSDPAVEVLAPDGTVDTSYGTGGLAIATPPANASEFVPIVPAIDGGNNTYSPASPVTMAVQADGSIVLTANAVLTAGGASEIVATRFNPSGAVDAAFGVGGDATITAPTILPQDTAVSGSAIALQPDGKIVIGGSIHADGSFGRMLLVRLDADGQPDPNFGPQGAEVPGGSSPIQGSYARAIAVQPDGKIVAADGWTSDLVRLGADGQPDPTFGVDGTFVDDTYVLLRLPIPDVLISGQPLSFGPGAVGLAITPANKILVSQVFGELARLIENGAPGDFNEDGISDPAIFIASTGVFGYVGSGGGGQLFPFGPTGLGNALPAPGAYDGFGIDEPAIYLPKQGEFVIQPYSTSPNTPPATVTLPFGLPDYNSLPAPGDYTGSGRTGLGIYDPSTGIYAYRPGGVGPDVYVKIGGTDPSSVPVPADYFGTGRDDVAIFEPNSATFLIQNPANGQVISIPFGVPSLGNTVPVPGDYDGSGRAELAAYLPNLAEFVYRSAAGGGADVVVPFGAPGVGGSLPAPGDYDGSGHLEVGAYLEASGLYAYRPADGDRDVYQKIGAPYQTLPFNLASATDATVLVPRYAMPAAAQASPSDSADIPLTPDVLDAPATPLAKKKPGLA